SPSQFSRRIQGRSRAWPFSRPWNSVVWCFSTYKTQSLAGITSCVARISLLFVKTDPFPVREAAPNRYMAFQGTTLRAPPLLEPFLVGRVVVAPDGARIMLAESLPPRLSSSPIRWASLPRVWSLFRRALVSPAQPPPFPLPGAMVLRCLRRVVWLSSSALSIGARALWLDRPLASGARRSGHA